MPYRTIEQKRAVIAEARRRIAAGERSEQVRVSLDVPKTTWSRWSRMMGFRVGDLRPDDPSARALAPAGPGPGTTTTSGRYLFGEGLGRPRSGGRKPALSPDAKDALAEIDLGDELAVLEAARGYEQAGDLAAGRRAAEGQAEA